MAVTSSDQLFRQSVLALLHEDLVRNQRTSMNNRFVLFIYRISIIIFVFCCVPKSWVAN